MNIFARLFAPPRNLSPAGPVVSVASQRGQSGAGGYVVGCPRENSLDPFQRKYGTPEYLPGIRWRLSRFHAAPPPVITKAMFDSVIEQAKPFTAADREVMEPIRAAYEKAGADLQHFAYLRTGELIRASLPNLKTALRAGQPPPPTPSWEETQSALSLTRRALHEIRSDCARETFPIIKTGCERLYAALQAKVKELEADMRGGILARWRMQFRPDGMLRALIYFALHSMTPVREFENGGVLEPTCDPLKLWGFVIESQPAPLPPGTTMQQTRAIQRDIQEAALAKTLVVEQAEHERKLAEINKFNDAIRGQGPNSPPVRAGYFVKPAPTPEADKQQS